LKLTLSVHRLKVPHSYWLWPCSQTLPSIKLQHENFITLIRFKGFFCFICLSAIFQRIKENKLRVIAFFCPNPVLIFYLFLIYKFTHSFSRIPTQSKWGIVERILNVGKYLILLFTVQLIWIDFYFNVIYLERLCFIVNYMLILAVPFKNNTCFGVLRPYFNYENQVVSYSQVH
jgi:hypothetical protein